MGQGRQAIRGERDKSNLLSTVAAGWGGNLVLGELVKTCSPVRERGGGERGNGRTGVDRHVRL